MALVSKRRGRDQVNTLVGTFLVCFGLLAYELFCSRILEVVVGPFLVIFVIAWAMLGMSAAASILSVMSWPSARADTRSVLSMISAILVISYLCAFFLITVFNNHSNEMFSAAMDDGGLVTLVETTRASLGNRMVLASLVLFAPYFIFGVFIAAVFKVTPAATYTRLYCADLLGAASGCVFFVVVFDRWGYTAVLCMLLLSTFLGSLVFGIHRSKISLAITATLGALIAALVFKPFLLGYLEPQPELNQLAKNYNKKQHVEPMWHGWNNYTRVALLSLEDRGAEKYVYSLGAGRGWAKVPNYVSGPAEHGTVKRNPQPAFSAMFNPKNVLIIFAGVGDDMVDIDRLCGGQCKITGVEINKKMVEHALSKGSFRAKEFLTKANVSLIIAEAREYLERDTGKYDAILLSWWGAGVSYHAGTSRGLAQYLYTKEAFESLLDHLTPAGVLIFSNGSKARTLVMLRQIFEERGWTDFAESVVVAKARGSDTYIHTSEFYDLLDSNRLLVSRKRFDAGRLETIRQTANEYDHELILAPGYSHPDYEAYRTIVEGTNTDRFLESLKAEKQIDISTVTDDRPFSTDFTPPKAYLDVVNVFSGAPDIRGRGYVVKMFFYFFVFIVFVATVLTVGPLLLKRGPRPTWRNSNHLLFFMFVGIGFMLIEVGFVQKFGLVLGNPGYAISVVLAALILATGVGSLLSEKLFERNVLTFYRTVLFLLAYVIAITVGFKAFVPIIMPLSLVAKAVVIVLVLLPMGFLMGQLFPQGLIKVRAQDRHLVPWAWAINGAASTIAVGLGFLMSHPLGYAAVIYTGAAFYAATLCLPEYATATLQRRRVETTVSNP